jgi:predicted RNase H-like HicB family nuclease
MSTSACIPGGQIQHNRMMQQSRRLTAIIEREGDGYVALCPEVDVASQGESLEEARVNLIEALTLFFETADASEIEQRLHSRMLRAPLIRSKHSCKRL